MKIRLPKSIRKRDKPLVKLHRLTRFAREARRAAVASPFSGFRRGAEPRTESHSSTPSQAWLSGAWVDFDAAKIEYAVFRAASGVGVIYA